MAAEDGDTRDSGKGAVEQDREAGQDGAESFEQERFLQDECEEIVSTRESDCGKAAERGDGADAVQQEEGGAGCAEASGVREGPGCCDERDGVGQGASPGPASGGEGK